MALWFRKVVLRFQTRTVQQVKRSSLSTTCKLLQDQEEMDKLQQNPYYSKYAGKIAKLQNTSPEDFLNRLAKLEESVKSSSAVKERDFSMPTKPKGALGSDANMKKEKGLSDVMKLELIQDKSTEEISAIWREHFQSKNSLCAVIPSQIYTGMKELFSIHKTFLLPLPRKEGYEFFVVQFAGNEAHFTSLINFQAFNENAPECLTLVHYTDLADAKGVVLMVGEFDNNILNIQDAQCLANQIEMYYCNPSAAKKSLLETFTFKPAEFKHQDLVGQIENISLLTESPSSSSTSAGGEDKKS